MQNSILSAAKVVTAIIAVALAPLAFGQSLLYWDSNGMIPGAGLTPTGTWGTDDFWNSASDGIGTTGPWIPDGDGVFSAGGDAIGGFTVTVSGTQSAYRLRFEEGAVTLSGGTITLTGAGEVDVASGLSAAVGSVLGGSVGLTKTESGTLALSGANTYTGATKVNAGILDFTTDGNLGATPGAFTQDSVQMTDSTLRFSGTAVITLHTNRGFILGGSTATIDCVGAPGILFIPNIIDGPTTTLVKAGAGELGLYGASNKFAKIVLDLGTLRVGQSSFPGYDQSYGGIPAEFTADAITIRNGATNRTVGSTPITISANRGITLGAGGGVFRSDVQPLTIHSAITGPGGLRKEGNRNFTLNGNNTYLGNTILNGTQSASQTRAVMTFNGYNDTPGTLTMNDGRLTLNNVNNFGSVSFNGGRIDARTNDALGSGTVTITPGGTNTILLVNDTTLGTGPLTNVALNNDIVLNPGTTNIDIAANSGRELNLNGKVSGAANWIKNNSGSTGALGLNNPNNDFSGSLQIFAGTLIVGANNALGATTAGTIINSGASLAFRGGVGSGFNYTAPEPVTISGVGRLNGGAISNASGHNSFSGPVTLAGDSVIGGVSDGSLTLNGVINETGGAHALTNAFGTLTLTAANTYSGGTVVRGGSLHVANPSGSATGPGPVIVENAALSGTGSIAGTVTLNGLVMPGMSPGGQIPSPGTLNTGSETWNGGGASGYIWEINDADAGAGTDPGWDLLNINGSLTINAATGPTPADRFFIYVGSLSPGGHAGELHDFNSANDYAWTIVKTTGGISGFDPAKFELDLGIPGFSNPLGSGTFRIETANGGNDLVLRFVHPPVIAAGPVGGTAECGSTFNFSVTASGSEPLLYQWKHAGTNLPGANASTLSVTASAETAGAYAVEVSNAYGTASSAATLTVEDTTPPDIVCAPNLSLECGAPWDFTPPTVSDVCSGNNVTITVMSTVTNNVTGGYAVTRTWVATDQANLTDTCSQTVTVLDSVAPTITCPSPITVCTSSNSALVEFAPVTTDACDLVPNIICNPPSGTEFLIGTNQISCTASDDAGNSSECSFTVTVLQNTTATGPSDSSVCTGGTITLSTTAAGTGPITYQWRKGGTEMVNETNSSITITGASTTDVATYTVEVTGVCNSVTNSAALSLRDVLTATGPENTTACAGTTVTLTTTAVGAGPLTYQWRKGETALQDQTNSSLVLPTVGAADAASYCVEITGACASVTNCATVAVNPVPMVAVNSATICAGNTVTLTATTDASNPSYLWSPGGESTASIMVSPSSTTTYTVTVTEATTTCSASASGTVTVNPLPMVSVNSATVCDGGSAVLTATTDADSPSYLWSPGGETTASITVSPASTTTYTCTVTAGTMCSASASGTVTVRGYDHFANNSTIIINDNAAASPYPSVITVSGLTATVCRVTVSLDGLSHAFPDDLDILLIGPNGEAVLLMSDVGNAFGVSGVNLTFDDSAASSLADSGQIVSGTFKPSNIGSKSDNRPDVLPAPAPTIRYGTNLSAFNNINPNGAWNLFVFDDELVDIGQIAGGWSLAISTLNPIADVGISQLDIPDPVGVGSNLTYTVIVTNLGPSVATGVLASDSPPAGASLVSFEASQGSCTLVGGTIWCALGSIAPGESATITIVVSPTAAGTLVNTASVDNDEVDFVSANNSSTSSTTVLNPPVITTGPQSQVVCADATVTFTVVATGEPPLSYQWYFGIDPISGATSDTLIIPNAQPPASGGYAVIVNNAVGAASASATLTVNPLPMVAINPAAPTICAGQSLTLTADNNASNAGYLWSPGGETTQSIMVSPATTTTYSVLVTDGTTTCTNSASATVTVNQLTTASALTSVTNACPGTSVSFSTTAGGAGPHTYVWRKGATVLPETSATLTLAAATAEDGATYCVEVTGVCNSITNCAALTVVAPPTITSQPQNIIRPMGNSASFSVTASGVQPITYQWLFNGSPIAGETAATLNLANLSLAQSGQYSVVVSNCAGTVTSAAATLTVTPIAGISFDFDTPGQFTNTPYRVQQNDWLHLALPTAIVESSRGGVGDTGALDLQGTADSSSILHPVSYDFSQDGKTLVASVMVRIVAPTQNNRNTQIGFVTATNGYAGNAPGVTPTGYTDPSTNGFMTVILQSTAQPALTYQLFLQHRRTDGGLTTLTSTPPPQATLTAGNWYKLVAKFRNLTASAANTLSVEGSLQDMGANGLAPGAVVMSYAPTNIVNSNLVTQRHMFLALRSARSDTGADLWDNIYAYATPGPVFFVAQPASQTVLQGGQATFTALVDGEGPYSYQWNRNESPIAGARSWKYITPPAAPGENGDRITVTVTGPANSITSDPATLSVTANPLAVVSVGSVDGCLVGVRFNQPVDRATAENPANYQINGVAAAAARVHTSTAEPNATRVLLTPASNLSGAFSVSVQNVQDLSGGTIGAANSASGVVAGLTGADINPSIAAPPGQNYSFGPGQFEVTGGGVDIFTAPDSFRYVYTQKSGDFDVKVRVPYQDVMRQPSKAGFDVRVSLDPTAPHVLAAVNPKWPARQLYEGTRRQDYNVGGTSWGAAGTRVQYPDGWLRYRRVGNTFMRYSSQNGSTWQFDGQFAPSPAFPNTVYFGLAVCAVANGNPATAQFESYGDFAGYSGATIAITTQPVGNATVNAGSSSNLSVVATLTGGPAQGELTYLWQRSDGSGGWTNIPSSGGTNNVLNTGALFTPDNGAQYRVIVKAAGAADVISDATTVTVNDGTAPTLSSATAPGLSTHQVVLVFSEPVASATALNTANYTVTNAAGADLGVASVALTDARTILLTTVNFLTLGTYGVRVSNVQDLNGNAIAANSLRTFSVTTPAPAQPVVIEYFGDVTGGGQVSLLTAHAKFTGNAPDFIVYSNSFVWNIAPNIDNYGLRVTTYFVPPSNGVYRFWIRNDDQAQVFMNTNNTGNSTDPAGKSLIADITAVNANYVNAAQNLTLTGGRQYYLEALLKENTGGDFISLAVRAQANTGTPPNTEFITGSMLAYPAAIAPATPVLLEMYRGPTGNQIADQLAAYNTPSFIAGIADLVAYEKAFGCNQSLGNTRVDNYLGRLVSYFIPPSTGLYRFWIRSDDSCQFYMNTNAANSTDPAGKVLLGQLNSVNANYNAAAQNVYLVGGQRYFMEGLWKEGTGGDGMTVAVRPQSDGATPPTTESIPASQLELPAPLARVGAVSIARVIPLNPTVSDGATITFSAIGFNGAPPYTILWLKNGRPVFANSATFTTQPLSASDNGAVFTVVVNNAFSRAEASSTVTVLSDGSAPTIVSALGGQTYDYVTLTFSEPVELASATCIPNYDIAGLTVLDADLDLSRTRVNLRTTTQTPGTTYSITVNGVRDASSTGNVIAPDSVVSFTALISGGCNLFVEVFTNITGGAVANFIFDPKVVNNLPDVSGYVRTFFYDTRFPQGPSLGGFGPFAGNGLENYGARVSGLFTAPSNGTYRFYLRSDDASQLWMNVNASGSADPAGKQMLISVPSANLGYANAAAVSPNISLNGGQQYYIEALVKEGTGGDYISAAFRPTDAGGAPIGGVPPDTEFIPGSFFSAGGSPDINRALITQAPPSELTVAENDLVNLTVTADITPPGIAPFACYIWQKLDASTMTYTNIPGAVNPSYSFYAREADDGTQFRVTFTMPGTNMTFNTLLHVTPDITPPFIVKANSLNGINIDLCFSEPITPGTAIDPFNYKVNGGDVNIIDGGIVQRSNDLRQVTITLATPVTTPFTVEAMGIRDFASRPVEDPGNYGDSSATGRVRGFVTGDVGTVAGPGYSFSCYDDEIDVVAGGADIWGNSDNGHLTLTPRSGNFDIHARVQSLRRATGDNDNVTKAGLMVRETFDAASRTLHLFVNPPGNLGGRDQGEAAFRALTAGTTADWVSAAERYAPVGIPNGWVRLKRVGNVFTAYRSTDGVNWVLVSTISQVYSNTVFIGLGTTAHFASGLTFAEYRNIHIPDTPTITEQPGPLAQTVNLHDSASYSVTAANPPDGGPLTYQWRRNGVAVPGATGATLAFNNLQASDAGIYTVEVGNDGGAVLSTPVTLNVNNGLPVVGPDSLSTTQNVAVTTTTANLLGNDSDPEGDPLSLTAVSGIYPVTFSADFNDGQLPAGTTFPVSTNTANTARIGDDGSGANAAVHLTDSGMGSALGAWLIPDLTGGKNVNHMTARWRSFVGGSTTGGAQFGRPGADGYSLSWGANIPDSSGQVGYGAPGEEGVGTGLIFSIDTWDNGGGEAPAIEIKWQGARIAFDNIVPGDPGAAKDFLRKNAFVDAEATVDVSGRVTFTYGGRTLSTQLPGWTGIRGGQFIFGARTGGAHDNHWIDDVRITALTSDTARNGTVALNQGTGEITYTPAPDTCGLDKYYYIASDGQVGGTSIGEVTVSVAETTPTPPSITSCATNVTLVADASTCLLPLPDLRGQIVATDNCCCPAITQTPAPGTMIGLGDTVVTFTATDAENLTATCQATVTVIDTTAPVITLAGDNPFTLECHSATAIPVATASDNCAGDITASIVVSGTLDRNTPGAYTLRYNVSDPSGNAAAELTLTVNVVDTLAPSITCPADVTAFRSSTSDSEQVYYTVTVADACDPTPTLTCTPPSGSSFTLGTHTVSCTAIDDTGNSSGCSFSVTVKVAAIMWVSDNPEATDNTFPPLFMTAFDDAFIRMLQNAGHSLARFNNPNSQNTQLSAAQIAALNTNDLIIIGRGTSSGGFRAPQGAQWNTNIVKPLMCMSPYLVRTLGGAENRMGWFVGATLPDTTPTRVRAVDLTDPETDYIFGGVQMIGDTTANNFDEPLDRNTSTIVEDPVAGGKKLATATFVPQNGGAQVTGNIITEFPAGTLVRGGVDRLPAYRMFFAGGSRETGGAVTNAGKENLSATGESIFLRAVIVALNGGVAPIDLNSPLGFTSEPVSLTVDENRPASFSASLTGAPPRTVQWQRDIGDGINFTNIPGASAPWLNSSYAIAAAKPSDAGYYRVVASNPFGTVTSAAAQLTVLPDTVAPTIVRAVGKWTLTNAIVSFSEPLNPDSVIDNFSYQSDNGLSVEKARLDATGTNVVLETSPQTPGTVYTLTINGIQDRAAEPNPLAPDSKVSFTAWVPSRGFLISELFFGIPGNAVTTLLTNVNYPHSPDRTTYVNVSSNAPAQGEAYGGRLVGWIIPPVDGSYNFYIRGDDGTELRLSPSADPEGRVAIAFQTAANQPYTSGPSAPQTLVGGQRYFMEALWKEGTGGDFVQVAWQTPLSTAIEAIACEYLEQYANPEGVSVNIVSHPQNGDVFENRTVTFSVAADIAPATLASTVCYEWQKGDGAGGFTNVHAPNTATFTTPLMKYPEDDASLWRVIVSVPAGSATSQVATVTVSDDLAGPVVLSSASVDGLSVGICFDELLDSGSAIDTYSYRISDSSISVTGAVLRVDGRSVHLQLDGPLPPDATVIVEGVLDLALNLIDSTSLTLYRHGLTAHDIGGPGLAGSHFTCDADTVEIVGGGTDIWGMSDQAYFAHRPITGDFDARVRVKDLAGADNTTKAALMVRETTNGGSRTIHVNVNPANRRNQFEPGQRTTTGGATAAWGTSLVPAGIPNCWLRIRRSGDLWSGYFSTNGTDWQLQAQTTQSYPKTLLLGLAVTAHNNAQLATGAFSNFTIEQPVADVGIAKLDAPDPVYVNGNVTYTISVTNFTWSEYAANGVVVTDTLPVGTTFVSATASQGSCTNSAGVVTCSLGTLGIGETATVTIVVQATTVGTNINTAVVDSYALELNPADNSATVETRVVEHPRITNTSYANGTFSASFQSEVGYVYEIRYKNSLTDATWTLLTTITGDGTVMSFTDPDAGSGTVPHRFFIIIIP